MPRLTPAARFNDGNPHLAKVFELMEDKKWPLKELAYKSGVPYDTLRNYRTKKKWCNPSIFIIECLYQSLGYKLALAPLEENNVQQHQQQTAA